VFGNWLRAYLVPFWSFQEISFKRYPRIFMNALKSKSYGKAAGVLPAAAFKALAASRVAFFYAGTYLWNNLFFPEEEKKLAPWEKYAPHLILGKRVDGSIRVFRRFGASSELVEWFGLDTLMNNVPKYLAGQITLGDLATDAGLQGLNKAIGGINPMVKGIPELATGQSYFPDVSRPRPKDRMELFAGIWSLDDAWKEITGRWNETGARGRPDMLERRFVGISSPGPNALSEIGELARKFKDALGKDTSSYGGKPGPFLTMRKAAEYGDQKAFVEAAKVYVGAGRDYADFRRALERLDPVNQLSRSDRAAFESSWLTRKQDKDNLRIARDHVMRLRPTMLNMWLRAGAELGQAQAKSKMERQRQRYNILQGNR